MFILIKFLKMMPVTNMNLILFSMYYCKLQLSVLLGIHKTANPLDLSWRWQHWKYKYRK